MSGFSALTVSAASLSSVSGEGSGNANNAKDEPVGIKPSIKVVPVASDPITSGRLPSIVKKPLVANSESKPNNGGGDSCKGQIPFPKAHSSRFVRQGKGSHLNFTSPSGEAATGLAGVVTVDSESGSDQEVVHSFTRFMEEIGGCSAEELLAGGKQAYYSIAVLIGLLASHTKPAITVSSLNEEEEEENTHILMNSDEVCSLMQKELSTEGGKSEKGPIMEPGMAEIQKELQSVSVGTSTSKEKVVKTITSLLPISRPLAEKIYNTWTLQNDGRANLFSIAAPSDYILDVKLIGFVELSPPILSPSSSLKGPKDKGAAEDDSSKTPSVAYGEIHLSAGSNNLDASLVELDCTNVSKNSSPHESNKEPAVPRVRDMFDRQLSYSDTNLGKRQERPLTSRQRNLNLGARIKKLFSSPFSKRKDAVMVENTASNASESSMSETELNTSAEGTIISVNGNISSTIPSTALACVFLTLEAVVPPSRYTSDYDWYYKRIVGFESESERIMIARVLSQSSPTLFVSFFDFLNRMFVGKQLQFGLNRAACKKIGIPEDASKYTPAMQKLMCLYLDSSKKWILSDLIPLHPTNYKLSSAK
ncbi:unnamed protein product [Phytomonas sp. EM1]|nr:unnamed protein product [Phytomonas sp. EM1]|eukprot:CCW61850.1 unnamed protein product [Phytomonas sp. isolate EM1]